MINELLALINVVLWAYIIAYFVVETILKEIRTQGRPSMGFKFYALIFSLLVVSFFGEWLKTNLTKIISNINLDPPIIYLILIVLGYYIVKKYKLAN